MSYPSIPYITTPTGFISENIANYGLAYDGSGNIWITNWSLQQISIINVNTYTTTIISSTTFGNLTNPDSIIYDYVNNTMWITDITNNYIGIIPTSPPYNYIPEITISGLASIAFDGINMWILYEYNSSIDIINSTTYDTTNLDVSSYITNVSGIGFDGTYIWIFSNNTTHITLYTASTQTYFAQLTNDYGFSNFIGTTYYCYLQNNNMWITNVYANVLSIVNITTYNLIATYSGVDYGIQGTSGIGYDSINNKIWIIDWYESKNAYILSNTAENPTTGYYTKVNGVETDLSLIFKPLFYGTKSTITTNYNVNGYGDLNNIFAALNDGDISLTYNTLYSVNVNNVPTDLSQIFLN
jgi:hypothetical protein